MSTKGDIINEAYQELRISGLTVGPTALDISMALRRLESMMSELFTQWNLAIGYNFQVTPSTTQQTNVPENFRNMMVTNLAVRLIAAFGKDAPKSLMDQASQSVSSAIGIVQAANLQQVQPPRRMPVGSGNTYRGLFWNRFATPVQWPPDMSSTQQIQQGETLTFYEDFAAFLGTATIASYTIVADPLLTIDTSANASPRINYTVTAPDDDSGLGPWQQIKITITDSLGRTLIKVVNFQVTTPPDVGPNV